MESFLENSRSSHFKVSRGPENFHENITVNQLITILVDTNLNTIVTVRVLYRASNEKEPAQAL